MNAWYVSADNKVILKSGWVISKIVQLFTYKQHFQWKRLTAYERSLKIFTVISINFVANDSRW